MLWEQCKYITNMFRGNMLMFCWNMFTLNKFRSKWEHIKRLPSAANQSCKSEMQLKHILLYYALFSTIKIVIGYFCLNWYNLTSYSHTVLFEYQYIYTGYVLTAVALWTNSLSLDTIPWKYSASFTGSLPYFS